MVIFVIYISAFCFLWIAQILNVAICHLAGLVLPHFLRSELGYLGFDISFFYLLHTLYVFICYAKIMPASAMKACFLIAERRTIFCTDTLNICNFQIFRAVFYIEEWNFLFYNKAKGGGNNWTFARFAPLARAWTTCESSANIVLSDSPDRWKI